ncbi:MOP flippase family protein [Porticoccaceae bacterium]|nr:MOP flippase family protein [Porticoccaceae bacterium]
MNLKEMIISGVKWSGMSSIVVSILQLIQIIVLTKYLSSVDLGLMALVNVIVGFSTIFGDAGMSAAIIHKQDISKQQLSSLYWLNVLVGGLLAITLFYIAPSVAYYYSEDALAPLLKTLAITFFVSALGSQFRTLLQKGLFFDRIAKVEIVSSLLGFIVCLQLLVTGFGVISFVYGAVAKSFLSAGLYLIYGLNHHIPQLTFRYSELKGMIRFGSFQMGEKSINYFNSHFDTLLIGKLLGVESLGIYAVAKTLVMKPAQIVNPIVTNVTFPVLAKVQNSRIKVKEIYLKTLKYLCSVNAVLYAIVYFLAFPIVVYLYGENWLGAVLIVKILSLYYVIRSTINPIGSLQLAMGRADLGFYWNLALFIFCPLAVFFGSSWGLEGVGYSLLVFVLLISIPNWFFMVKPLCGAGFIEYFKVIITPFIIVACFFIACTEIIYLVVGSREIFIG